MTTGQIFSKWDETHSDLWSHQPIRLEHEMHKSPAFSMDDLANAIQRVRVDFGVHIRFTSETYPLDQMRPGPDLGSVVKRGWALGTIKYPGTDKLGILLYLQASPIAAI